MDTDPRRHRTRPELRTAVWRKTRKAVMGRDHWSCQYCGATATLVDHVIPWTEWKARGGAHNDPANLKAACASCNNRKKENLPINRTARERGERTPYDFRVHWHPAGADWRHQLLIGTYQRTAICPCEPPDAA